LNKRILIVAGEASGDLHGSKLVKESLLIDPDLTFFGIGGRKMREEGVEILVDASEMAVVGLVEILSHFRVIYRAYSLLKKIIRTSPPDLLILIDYPEFNLRLAKIAKSAGVKVLYYISPQVWAWRVGRVKKIGRLVDMMVVVFPFEVPFYEREGVPVTFVGHPLVDSVKPSMERAEAIDRFGLAPTRKTVGLFPGSRRGEIKNLLGTIIDAAVILHREHTELQFVLPLAPSLAKPDIDPYLKTLPFEVKVVEGEVYDVMQVCDAIISVSGTVTLEAALMETPMVIIYRVSPLSYEIGKRLIKVDHIGLCNIVASERIVKELIQDDADPELIAAETSRLLTDREYAEEMRTRLRQVRSRLGKGGGAANVARVVIGMLAGERYTP
jgi:lipid-A-disaccharide synthase